MPELNQARIASLTGMLLELLDAADLDDDQADVVCEILLQRMLERSGLGPIAFRAAVQSAFGPRR